MGRYLRDMQKQHKRKTWFAGIERNVVRSSCFGSKTYLGREYEEDQPSRPVEFGPGECEYIKVRRARTAGRQAARLYTSLPDGQAFPVRAALILSTASARADSLIGHTSDSRARPDMTPQISPVL